MANAAVASLTTLNNTVTGLITQVNNEINTLQPASSTGGIKTNHVQLDPIFNNVAAYGTVSITLDYENHPTASITLISNGDPFPTQFTQPDKKVVLYGIPFRVSGATESVPPRSNTRKLSVSLEGWNRYLCDKPVFYNLPVNVKTYTLGSIASRVGASVAGGTALRLPAESAIVSTTLGDTISTILSNTGYFVDFNSEQIRLSDWDNGSSRSIPEDEIIQLDIDYKSQLVEGVIYPPTQLLWGSVNQTQSVNTEPNALNSTPKFKKIPLDVRIVLNDPENAAVAPDSGRITDFQMNYDMSGPTKVREINTYAGEVLIKKDVYVYGYAYTSRDIGATLDFGIPSGVTLSPYWKLVEQYTIFYINEPTFGYYLGYTKTGKKMVRFRREEQDCEYDEAIKNAQTTYTRQLPGGGSVTKSYPNIIEIINNYYKFKFIPIEEYERYEVKGFANYYPDARPKSEELYVPYEIYDTDGQTVLTRYAKNEAYTPPGFIERRVMYSNCFAWMYAPPEVNEGEMVDKIVTTGEQKKEVVNISIHPKDQGYTEYREVITAQDGTYKNSFKEVSSSSSTGRPPQADFTQLLELEQKDPSTENNDTVDDNLKVIVYSSNFSGTLRTNNSVSFDLQSTKESAFTALKKVLNKQYLFVGDEFTVTCLFRGNVKPGDKLECSYRGLNYKGIVKSVSHNIEIKDVGKATGLTSITCGIQNEKNRVSLLYTSRNNNDNPDAPKPYTSGYLHLGDVNEALELYNNLPRRGQF